MNLHLSHDNVFIDYIINSARELNLTDHKFLIQTHDGIPTPQLVKNTNIVYAAYDTKEFWNLVGDATDYHTIYIHFMHGIKSDFVNRLPASCKIVWCFWGGDGLELPSMLKNVYQNKSYDYYQKNYRIKWFSFSPKWTLSKLKLIAHTKKVDKENLKAIARVNYFAHYLEADFNLIKQATFCKATFIPFHYASFEDLVPERLKKMQASGNSILLGNSDTLTNNHFEAIDKLAELNLGDAKVYCPLSYEKGQYAEDVALYGKQKLKSNFIPLLEFLPKEEYEKTLGAVSIAIMNHNRSQALGNILALLYSGVKLYMSEDSTLFQYFKKNGMAVFSIQKELSSQHIFIKLSTEEIQLNHNKMLELFGKESHLNKLKNLLTI